MAVLDLTLELAGGIFTGPGDPPGDRALIAGFTAISLAGGIAAVVVVDPDIRRIAWMVAIVSGLPGALVSVLHIRRNEDGRVFGICCLLAIAVAPLLPTLVG